MLNITQISHQTPWDEKPSLRDGRCWIFPANRDISDELPVLSRTLDPFLQQWAAHGAPVQSEAALLHGHFLVIAEGLAGEASSGCSQDSLRQVIRDLEKSLQTQLMAGGRIYWMDGEGGVSTTDRKGFQAAYREGRVNPETLVFDTLIEKTADIRRDGFLKAAANSWHQKLFG